MFLIGRILSGVGGTEMEIEMGSTFFYSVLLGSTFSTVEQNRIDNSTRVY